MTRLLSLALLALVALVLAYLWRQRPAAAFRIAWPIPDLGRNFSDSSSADPLP